MKISVFDSYMDAAEMLDDGERLQFYDAIFRYAFRREEPDLSSKAVRVAWAIVKPFLDSSINGVENGKKGGRPTKTEGVSKGVKTPVKTPTETPPKTQYEGEEEDEGEGFRTLESSETVPDGACAAGGDGPAAPRAYDNAAVFREVDERFPDPTGYEPKDMAAYLEAHNAAFEDRHPDAYVPTPEQIAEMRSAIGKAVGQ